MLCRACFAEVDLLSIPPFSKKVKGWTIRQVPAPGKDLLPTECGERPWHSVAQHGSAWRNKGAHEVALSQHRAYDRDADLSSASNMRKSVSNTVAGQYRYCSPLQD